MSSELISKTSIEKVKKIALRTFLAALVAGTAVIFNTNSKDSFSEKDFREAFGSARGSERFRERFDVNKDGFITIRDYTMLRDKLAANRK